MDIKASKKCKLEENVWGQHTYSKLKKNLLPSFCSVGSRRASIFLCRDKMAFYFRLLLRL